MPALFLVLSFISSFSSARLVIIHGQVIDALSRKPIELATVYIAGRGGAYTDSLGNFTANFNSLSSNDTLIVSSIGYETAFVPLKNTDLHNLIISLQPKSYITDPVIISAKAAMLIVKKAIEKIPDNFQRQPFQFNAFFRQTHYEDGHWCRLIEALLDIYDDGYSFYKGSNLQEYIRVNSIRRSGVTERNGYTHGDHLVDLLLENFVRYPGGRFTNPEGLEKYDFSFDSLSSDSKYIIRYSNSPLNEERIRAGVIEIDGSSFAINRITELSYPNPAYAPRIDKPQDDWIFKEGHLEMKFSNHDGKMYLSEIHQRYKHDIFNYIFFSVDHVVEEYFDLWVGNVNTKPDEQGKGFSKQGGLYTKHYLYNNETWNKNELVKSHPLDESIKNAFEKYESLEKQFKDNE